VSSAPTFDLVKHLGLFGSFWNDQREDLGGRRDAEAYAVVFCILIARNETGEDMEAATLSFWSHKARAVDRKQELDKRREI